MNSITAAYDIGSFPTQENLGQPVEILSLEDSIVPVKEAVAFQRRLDTRLTYSQLRAHICLDYELGCVDAQTTMDRLKANNLYGNPDQFMAVYCAGVRALAGEGR